MAYSNWGAFVYKDGMRRKDREDVAVFNDDEKDIETGLRIFANIIKNREKYGDNDGSIRDCPWHEHSHHAVLGDGVVRLCGYKCSPELYAIIDGKIITIPINMQDSNGEDTDEGTGNVEVDGKVWIWWFKGVNSYDGYNIIDLKLIEPDGSIWTSRCGYEYGAGFEGDV